MKAGGSRAVLLGFALAAGLAALALSPADGVCSAGSDSSPAGVPEVSIPPKYRAAAVTEALGAPVGIVTRRFTPMDENTSTTVLFLLNPGDLEATVRLTTYLPDGGVYIDTSFVVPAGGVVRVSGDPVYTTAETWQDVVVVNFQTWSTSARLRMPMRVRVTGYVVWNNGPNYDPLQVAPTLPLTFLK